MNAHQIFTFTDHGEMSAAMVTKLAGADAAGPRKLPSSNRAFLADGIYVAAEPRPSSAITLGFAMLIQACLNGTRGPGEHPKIPVTPEQVAADAAATLRAGAAALHVHPRRDNLAESIAAADVAAVCTAVRQACPGMPVGVTAAAWIEPEPGKRLASIADWTVVPDYASVNL